MSQVDIATVEKNFDSILEAVGENAYVDWDTFTKSSSEVVRSIDELNRSVQIFREAQHRNFIQTMKKLKSLDLPDLVKTVKAKKLPKEALRTVLPRFKLEGEKLSLVEEASVLKENAEKQYQEYTSKNKAFIEHLQKQTEYFNEKIKESGYVPEQQQVMPAEIKSTVKFNLSQQKAQELASGIEIQYLHNSHQLIGLKTYSQIVDKSFDLVKPEHTRITIDARVAQRKVIKEPIEYSKMLNEYLNNTEALILEGQRLIASKVGLKGKKLEESEIALMERGLGQQILMLQSTLRAKVKESMPATKDVSLEVAKEVINCQTEMINNRVEELQAVFAKMEKTQETVQLIPMLLALILNDWIFEKYGYEEEDFMKNVQESVIQTNPEMMKIFQDMEVAIINLMRKLEIIPEDISSYMEQAAKDRSKTPQQLQQQQSQKPQQQGVVPPVNGMMPGSNPMDLLQMQQMQQMQQMMQNMQPPK